MDSESFKQPKPSLIKIWYKGIIWLLAIGAPLVLITIPVVTIYDAISPSPSIKSALLENYPSQIPICVGIAYHSVGSKVGFYQRSYIIIPQVFRTPKIVSISITNQTDLEIESSYVEFFFLLLYGFILIVVTFLLSIPRFKWLLNKVFPHSDS